MGLDFDMSAEHEMCSSAYVRFSCACITGIRGFTTTLSSQGGAAISR
jgi:hypothetical protein